jgi:hypothetical protein
MEINAMKVNKQGRRAYLESEARSLARSGNHRNFRTIETLLIVGGYPEARKLCANRWTQGELDRICQQAQFPNLGQHASN